jgi:hypothetical protein
MAWNCDKCTFLNKSINGVVCEMCEGIRARIQVGDPPAQLTRRDAHKDAAEVDVVCLSGEPKVIPHAGPLSRAKSCLRLSNPFLGADVLCENVPTVSMVQIISGHCSKRKYVKIGNPKSDGEVRDPLCSAWVPSLEERGVLGCSLPHRGQVMDGQTCLT